MWNCPKLLIPGRIFLYSIVVTQFCPVLKVQFSPRLYLFIQDSWKTNGALWQPIRNYFLKLRWRINFSDIKFSLGFFDSFQLEFLSFLPELTKMSIYKDVLQKIFSITHNINEEFKNSITYKNLLKSPNSQDQIFTEN